VIPNRKIVANVFGVFWVAAKAAIGPAKAIPVRTAAGMASTMSGDSAAWNTTMTIVNTVAMRSAGPRSRAGCRARCRAG